MMKKRRLEAFLADTLIEAIRDASRSGVHLLLFDPEQAGDSLDREADMQRRTAPPTAKLA